MADLVLEITAEITGVGEDSSVPDNPEATDADILINGVVVGSVTLLPHHDGHLATWGPGQDHWADAGMMRWLEGMARVNAEFDAIEAIEDAVEEDASVPDLTAEEWDDLEPHIVAARKRVRR
jgi:hypothetical protein